MLLRIVEQSAALKQRLGGRQAEFIREKSRPVVAAYIGLWLLPAAYSGVVASSFLIYLATGHVVAQATGMQVVNDIICHNFISLLIGAGFAILIVKGVYGAGAAAMGGLDKKGSHRKDTVREGQKQLEGVPMKAMSVAVPIALASLLELSGIKIASCPIDAIGAFGGGGPGMLLFGFAALDGTIARVKEYVANLG